ncbi:DoxX family protein [Flavobacterium wongokense]|uniref:DoxX family protein n=1 Tax=Flavobacterium wongokense TaxID=2910674 RepID=UPI001F302041|nr:DoxX family protein [Flavobacterium sp. WG47]MCF6132785.1 DoxX family protein [Flavobacterium sp. WG47]
MKTDLFKRINITMALLRIMLALALFPHGAQKMMGWYGGYGFEGTMGYFTETMKIPYIIALLVIIIEFIGPILLMLGVFTRTTSALIFALFMGIIFTSHATNGFFMNWFGTQTGEGYEYHLLILTISLAITIMGPGNLKLAKLYRKQTPKSN